MTATAHAARRSRGSHPGRTGRHPAGAAGAPVRPGLRRGAHGVERRSRPSSGTDHPLRRHRRRHPRGGIRAQRRAGAGRARRGPQHRRLLHQRRRRRPRPLTDEGHPGRPDHPPGRRAGRAHLGRVRPRDPGVRPGRHRRPRLDHRHRRVHPRRRDRLAAARVRPHLRQPALGRRRHRRRPVPHRQRARAPRPVLGTARRRRQLRCGHLVGVPACTRSAPPSSPARSSTRARTPPRYSAAGATSPRPCPTSSPPWPTS